MPLPNTGDPLNILMARGYYADITGPSGYDTFSKEVFGVNSNATIVAIFSGGTEALVCEPSGYSGFATQIAYYQQIIDPGSELPYWQRNTSSRPYRTAASFAAEAHPGQTFDTMSVMGFCMSSRRSIIYTGYSYNSSQRYVFLIDANMLILSERTPASMGQIFVDESTGEFYNTQVTYSTPGGVGQYEYKFYRINFSGNPDGSDDQLVLTFITGKLADGYSTSPLRIRGGYLYGNRVPYASDPAYGYVQVAGSHPGLFKMRIADGAIVTSSPDDPYTNEQAYNTSQLNFVGSKIVTASGNRDVVWDPATLTRVRDYTGVGYYSIQGHVVPADNGKLYRNLSSNLIYEMPVIVPPSAESAIDNTRFRSQIETLSPAHLYIPETSFVPTSAGTYPMLTTPIPDLAGSSDLPVPSGGMAFASPYSRSYGIANAMIPPLSSEATAPLTDASFGGHQTFSFAISVDLAFANYGFSGIDAPDWYLTMSIGSGTTPITMSLRSGPTGPPSGLAYGSVESRSIPGTQNIVGTYDGTAWKLYINGKPRVFGNGYRNVAEAGDISGRANTGTFRTQMGSMLAYWPDRVLTAAEAENIHKWITGQ